MEDFKLLAALVDATSQHTDMKNVKSKVSFHVENCRHKYEIRKSKEGIMKRVLGALTPTKCDRNIRPESRPVVLDDRTRNPAPMPQRPLPAQPIQQRSFPPPPVSPPKVPPRSRRISSRNNETNWNRDRSSLLVLDPETRSTHCHRHRRRCSQQGDDRSAPGIYLEYPDVPLWHSYCEDPTSDTFSTISDCDYNQEKGKRNDGSLKRIMGVPPPVPLRNRLNNFPDDEIYEPLPQRGRELPPLPMPDPETWRSCQQPKNAHRGLSRHSMLSEDPVDLHSHPIYKADHPSSQPCDSNDHDTLALPNSLAHFDDCVSCRHQDNNNTDTQFDGLPLLEKHKFLIPPDAIHPDKYPYNGVGGWYMNGANESTTRDSLESSNSKSSEEDVYSKESEDVYNKMKQLQACIESTTTTGQPQIDWERKCDYVITWI